MKRSSLKLVTNIPWGNSLGLHKAYSLSLEILEYTNGFKTEWMSWMTCISKPFPFCEGYCAPNHYSPNGLVPCSPCEETVNYQPEFGETSCIPCRSEKDDPSCDKGDSKCTTWINHYTMLIHLRLINTFKKYCTASITFAVVIPNVWGTSIS